MLKLKINYSFKRFKKEFAQIPNLFNKTTYYMRLAIKISAHICFKDKKRVILFLFIIMIHNYFRK